MHVMEKVGVFLTLKWASVLKQRLYVVFLASPPRTNTVTGDLSHDK